jgi:fumarate reductase flavoprotein subunit
MEERKKSLKCKKHTNQIPLAAVGKRRTLLKGAIGLGIAASMSSPVLHLTAEKAEENQCMTLPSREGWFPCGKGLFCASAVASDSPSPGGLRINTSAQVLDIWGNQIPRLHAAGDLTGGIEGSHRRTANACSDCVLLAALRESRQKKRSLSLAGDV